MILNTDCVRDVLLYIEEQDNMKLNGDFERIRLEKIKAHFSKKYTEEDVQYSVKNLFQDEFLEGDYNEDANHHFTGCYIYDVAYNGHIFADSIRPESIWKKSKDKIKTLEFLL